VSVRAGVPASSWQAVHADALRRIRERVWPPGALIPTEAVLAREFGCARATVNRALRELAEAGLLERRRRAGTRVVLHPARQARLSVPLIREEVAGRGAVHGYALLRAGRAEMPLPLRARLDLPAAAETLRVEALHTADGLPFVFEDLWINIAAVPGVLEADFASISANEWLVRHAPFTCVATEREAAQLGAAPGAALFVVERATRAGSLPVTLVRLAYAPGYRMTLTV
jgi:GntR family histidine utilization transcriptional repressor